ncbi:protein DpdH [Nocardioides yefusunii]|uniref:Protein DpdH n=1 Tax=Nocardioides yefusunii TaxID=2500546 RepID=A0ABW1R3Y3_9ACTN|nr:protein DpdH [Nocardioides yefusunii]
MTLQTNHACWTIADVVSTIPTEAATPSAEVLLATHAPLRITRHEAIARGSGPTIIDEQTVLEEFLEREPTKGILVAPVVGESGTGKSHLVRWVHANLVSKAPGNVPRHIIYLRKTDTSLKNVVERLLVGQQGPQFDEIRNKLDTLGASVSQETMEGRILDSLAEALENHEVTGTTRILTGVSGLALFFRDPLFREHLRREGSFVQRRARHALHGRAVDEADIPLEFTAEELPLDIVDFASVLDAAAATQKIFRLVSTNANLQNAAVEMVNELLHVAVTRAVGLSVGDISQAFLQMRANLLGDEIILLIEDVALIQGVRRDLLDAIVEPAEDQGTVKYATVRTMMAVTSGYYNETLPETFRYRAEASGPRYQVDMDLANLEEDEDFFADFVGRYLNAARVGKEALEAAAPNIPNPCHKCPFMGPCHATFGHDSEEHGLYPYNKVAVRRVVQTLADSRPDGARTFNPRRVLAKGVRDALREGAGQITGGQFPPAEFLGGSNLSGLPTLPLGVRAKIEADLPEKDAGRAISLLTFWGDAGKKTIPSDLFRAFSQESFAEISTDDAVAPPLPDQDPIGSAPQRVSPYSPALVKKLKAIDLWSAGEATLAHNIASDLRSIVREALLAKVVWLAPLIKDPDSATINKAIKNSAYSISIAHAGENVLGTSPVLTIPRSAVMGQLFTGLLLLEAGHAQDAGSALASLDALVTAAVPAAQQAILKEYDAVDAVIVDVATSLLVGAARCGQLPSSPKDVDLLEAVLWAPNLDVERADAPSRTVAWLAAHQSYIKTRPAVVKNFVARVGAAQGVTGAVYGIDVARLLPLLRTAWKQAKSPTAESLVLPAWAKESERLSKDLKRAAAAQVAYWSDLVERAHVHLPAGSTWSETLDVLTSTFTVASQASLVIHPNMPALQAGLQEARAFEGRSVADVAKVLTQVAGLPQGSDPSRLIGIEVGGDLSRVVAMLEQSAKWVDNGLEIAKGNDDDDTTLEDKLQVAIDDLRAIVDEYTPDTDQQEQTFDGAGAEHV